MTEIRQFSSFYYQKGKYNNSLNKRSRLLRRYMITFKERIIIGKVIACIYNWQMRGNERCCG